MICSNSTVTEHHHEHELPIRKTVPDPGHRPEAITERILIIPTSDAGAAPRPTPPAASKLRSARFRRRLNRDEAPEPLVTNTGRGPRPSSRATTRLTLDSTGRSTPIGAAEHGCFVLLRPADPRLSGLSAELDFETRLFAKENAAGTPGAWTRRPGLRRARGLQGATLTPISRSSGSPASPGR